MPEECQMKTLSRKKKATINEGRDRRTERRSREKVRKEECNDRRRPG
jgi:hypothetical protein